MTAQTSEEEGRHTNLQLRSFDLRYDAEEEQAVSEQPWRPLKPVRLLADPDNA